MTDGLFCAPLSFAGVAVSNNFVDADVAVLGIPYDCGAHSTRIGARTGPTWIRQHSVLAIDMAEDAKPNPIFAQHVVDAGNVCVGQHEYRNIEAFYDKTEQAVSTILEAKCIPVTMGGDGAVTLPQIRATAKHHENLTVLHFDAHTDTYPMNNNDDYDNATTFTHVAREGLVDLESSIHVGVRAAINTDSIVPYAEGLGYRVLPFARLADMDIGSAISEIREPLEGKPVYVCFDMDFFDPAFAPGVCHPTPGGASSHLGLSLLRGMAGLDVVACDINNVSPPHDLTDGTTANLAATVMLECFGLILSNNSR
jgi:agmatinase